MTKKRDSPQPQGQDILFDLLASIDGDFSVVPVSQRVWVFVRHECETKKQRAKNG
jgi:hypothetical protein